MWSPEELGEDAGPEHPTRGDDVPGCAHQKIREVRPRRQAAHHAVGERGPPHADPDESLEQPLPAEFAPARAVVGHERRGVEAAQGGDQALGQELGAPQRSVNPWPVNGSKKSAASPTSTAPPPGATAVRDHCANGPVARTSRTSRRGSNRPASPGNRSSSAKKSRRKSRPSPRLLRTAASGTTSATVVTPSPTGPRPT